MAARTWTILACALLATSLVAGCTNKDDPADDGTNETGGNGGTGGPPANASTPTDFNLTDSGAISGPFSQTWAIEVENVAFSSAMIHFALSGVQGGAPPTARVNLALTDPEGAEVMSATLGLGGAASVDWTLTAAELPVPGTYTLAAVADATTPLPSAGLANYELAATITY